MVWILQKRPHISLDDVIERAGYFFFCKYFKIYDELMTVFHLSHLITVLNVLNVINVPIMITLLYHLKNCRSPFFFSMPKFSKLEWGGRTGRKIENTEVSFLMLFSSPLPIHHRKTGQNSHPKVDVELKLGI